MRAVVVIPARFASTRLPGKPLLDIAGKPMIQRVYEVAARAKHVDEIIVATDDERIAAVVRDFGGKAMMTSSCCLSGTDRMLKAAKNIQADVYVNVQGDEPLLKHESIELLLRALCSAPDMRVATLCFPITEREAENANLVKVVRDNSDRALYFSRAPIPYRRDAAIPAQYLGHLGIYAYRAEALHTFGRLPASPLEEMESLEQLRMLQAGIPIHVLETERHGPSVDTPEDLRIVREFFAGETPTGYADATGASSRMQDFLRSARLLITDVDGVLTDGGLYYGQDGEAVKRFNVRDGFGVKLLQKSGIQVAALSGRDSPALRARLQDLGISLFRLGVEDKSACCREILEEAGISGNMAVFLGDDIPDIQAFAHCGLKTAVSDASREVLEHADWILSTPGGHGALRELADMWIFALSELAFPKDMV